MDENNGVEQENNINKGHQIVIRIDMNKLYSTILKLFAGLLLYFAIVNILLYFTYSIPFTPEAWIINPIHNLKILNPIAIITLIVCEVIGWFIFEIK